MDAAPFVRLSETVNEHARRIEAARERAKRDLGSPRWADVILRAYFDPEGEYARIESEDAELHKNTQEMST